ncbi:MAG: stage V sporulation protein T [Clostridia bacterium]|nr:stage V sporulation protein T [Clostridia bacterium]MBR3106239.1 stage V sporulation protein T [Clostridia bacterium]
MKLRATGIVRRIDELGRVVIPKEIRRTLRIREGDPLEIYTDRDGEVILKKYSPIGEMSSFAKDYTESLFRSLGHIACIVDRDQVVAASGVSKKELWDKPISPDLESAIQARQTVALNRTGGAKIVPVTNEEDVSGYTAQVVSPIIADGEAIGAVLLLSREQGAKMGDTELKVAETAAGIVGRQMEQ